MRSANKWGEIDVGMVRKNEEMKLKMKTWEVIEKCEWIRWNRHEEFKKKWSENENMTSYREILIKKGEINMRNWRKNGKWSENEGISYRK